MKLLVIVLAIFLVGCSSAPKLKYGCKKIGQAENGEEIFDQCKDL